MAQREIRILVTEDNPADVRLICEALAESCDLSPQITTAANGAEAIELLRGGSSFDLMILDLNMPKVSGFDVLEQCAGKSLPIVVFTSSTREADANRAKVLGASEVVVKPGTYEDFVSAVSGIVERWT